MALGFERIVAATIAPAMASISALATWPTLRKSGVAWPLRRSRRRWSSVGASLLNDLSCANLPEARSLAHSVGNTNIAWRLRHLS